MNIEKSYVSPNITKISYSEKNDMRPKEENEGTEAIQDNVNLGESKVPQKKELTVLFYLHGQYKDLHKITANTFFQLEQAGSDENVNIVAQLGRAVQDEPGKVLQNIDGDWSGVRRYYVTKHDHSDLNMTLDQWLEVEQKIPNNPVVHYCLGEVYWEKGDKEKAKAEYAKAKELGILKYIANYESDESKKIKEEVEAATKPYVDLYKDKQVYGSAPLQILSPDTKMGDPKTLKDFVAWGMKSYPANHYVLVVTGHGGAWIGALEMPPTEMNKAIKEGVAQVSQETGEDRKLDALIFNSCYMGNMEAAFEMKETADINISSENYSRGNILYDWNDHIANIQKRIKDAGEFDPREFAKDFVEYYRREGKEIKENFPEFIRWKESYLTLSAIDNKKIETVVSAWKDFIEACKVNKVPEHIIFKDFAKSQGFNSDAFNPAQTIFAFYDMIKDIGDLMKHVQENTAIPQPVKDQAKKVQQSLNDTLIAEQHEGKDMDNATGLTAWTPSNAVDIAFMANRYEKEDVPEFVKASGGYLDFLKSAVKGADQQSLKEFMADVQIIRNIRQILSDPSYQLTENEKRNLEDAREIITRHAISLKEKLNLTEPKIDSMWSLGKSLKPELDYAHYGNIAKDFIKDIVEHDGLKEGL